MHALFVKYKNIIILSSFALLLVACQQPGLNSLTGSSNDEINYNFIYDQADHLKDIVQDKDWKTADKLFSSHRSFFNEPDNKKSNYELLSVVATGINNDLNPSLSRSLDEVNTISIPLPLAEWNTASLIIERAGTAISVYNEYSITKIPGFQSLVFKSLNSTLSNKITLIKKNIKNDFNSFDITSESDFFDLYPTSVNITDFFDSQELAWNEKIAIANASQLKLIYQTYSKYLPSELKESFSIIYYKKLLEELSDSEATAFQNILTAISRSSDLGVPVTEISGAKVSFVDVTSRTLLKNKQIEFPVSIAEDMPFDIEEVEFENAFDNPKAKEADIIVVLDIAAAKTFRDISTYEKVQSEFRSGTQTVPNPRYAIAQANVNNAQIKYQGAAMNNATCYGLVCIVTAIGVAVASDDVKTAMAALRSTKPTLDKPIYQPYEFNKANIDVTKEATVNYYIIDRLSEKYIKSSFDAKQTQNFTVAYNLNGKDKRRSKHLSDTNKEEDIDKFEQQSIEVNLSDILRQFTDKSELDPLPDLIAIKENILADKNTAISDFLKNDFTATSNNDPRFENVVIVYHPGGGLGSGFYVRDDLVMTNYHVIEGAKYVELRMFDGQETFGKVLEFDVRLDLALIKIQARGKPVAFFESNVLPLGRTVEAIGHPEGLEFSITRGVISAMREIESRYAPGGNKIRFVQTDAAINPGNSGGPLFLGTKVAGMNTQKLAATEIEGLSFAVHYSEIMKFLELHDVKYLRGEPE